jgi:menaquinone-dependent protoporphyrinogen oxidase
MARLLLLYSTTDGHTRFICERLKFTWTVLGWRVSLLPLAQAQGLKLDEFARIVIGASIRYGHHQAQVAQFIAEHLSVLQTRPSAFFSVNAVARKPNKQSPQTNPYVRKFLARIAWKPALVGVFAGRINYPAYGWLDRHIIRLIMWITGGPTDTRVAVEFTDWAQVEAFAQAVVDLPAPGGAAQA